MPGPVERSSFSLSPRGVEKLAGLLLERCTDPAYELSSSRYPGRDACLRALAPSVEVSMRVVRALWIVLVFGLIAGCEVDAPAEGTGFCVDTLDDC